MSELEQRAREIRLLVLDVDGVMTDGRLLYGSDGGEIKAFNILDGLGIKLAQRGGIQVAIITGRRSAMVERRARELGIEHLIQGREDKHAALDELLATLGIGLAQTAYLGDDLPDLAAIRRVGLGMCVASAYPLLAEHARYQTRAAGGAGAVREACELLLRAQGKLDGLLAEFL